MSSKDVFVVKSSGEREPYVEEKVRSSVVRAGANAALAKNVVAALRQRLSPATKSETIYQCSLATLRKDAPHIAARYSLKRAIMNLGPAGYLFERFVARLLNEYGYATQVGSIVQGYCVEHEIDVSARRDKKHILIECKYHNRPGVRSDIQVALYTGARFDDVMRALRELPDHATEYHEAWLVTNTQCTSQAIAYARCRGLKILAWGYPIGKGLEHWVEAKQLYPVTVLPSLPLRTLKQMNNANVVVVGDLASFTTADLTRRFGIPAGLAKRVAAEAADLCRPPRRKVNG